MQRTATAVPMDRLVAIAAGQSLPERATGAAVFADISGFSWLATRLERRGGPELAAEQLSAGVDAVFGVLIDALHRSGGAAVSFAGDSVTGWLGDRPGAAAKPRALACALAMQRGVAELAGRPLPAGEPLRLAVRVGIAMGAARRMLVGDPAIQRIDVLAGTALARAVAAQHLARPGEVVASRDVAHGTAAEVRVSPVGDGAFARVEGQPPGLAGSWWPGPGTMELPPLDGWQHAAVLEHLEAGAPLLADLRRVGVLFARCPPIDFDDDEGAATQLDRLVRQAQRVLGAAGGTLLHVVIGEKGSYLVGAVGAPFAQPDHSRRLARAALALQDAVPDGLAVGLAEGRAWAGLVGTPERSCYTLLGGIMNRAARLMEHARPGEVYVAPRLARALASAFELRDAGMMTLKGEAEPVALTALTVARAAPRGRDGSTPLVGRKSELEQLRRALADAVAGERRWASVRGAPGLGKSRLLDALADGAGDGVAVVRVLGSATERATPYHAWREAFQRLVGRDPRPALAALPARAREYAPLLSPVFDSAPAETDATRALSTEGRQESTQRLLMELLTASRSGRPLLICGDDTQWLDSASAGLLRRAARELAGVLVVAAARPEAPPDEEPVEVRVELAPLTNDESLALVAQALSVDALPDAAGRFVSARAGGHPLFSEQLGYALRDVGVLEVVGRECRLAPGADLAAVEVPESVEGLIANRLDGMPADARAVAKVASVVGDVFTGALLEDLQVPGLAGEAGRALDRLAAAELITRGPQHAFRHALIRDVVYGRLLHGQRADLHRRVATHHETHRAGEHAVLAEHWERAGEPERATDHLELAGAGALRAGAFAECVALLERALKLGRGASARRKAEWRWHAAQATYRLGELEASRAFAEAAVAEFDRPVPRGGVGLAVGLASQALRQLAHRTPARRALARAPAGERERLRRAVRAYLNLAELNYLAARKPQSAYAVLRQLNLAETAGPTPELVEAYGALCVIGGAIGRHGIGERYAELAFAAAARVEDPYATAIIRHQASMFRSCTGDYERVFADEDAAVAMFRRMGDLGRVRDCLGVAGVAAHHAGRAELAERYFTALLETRRGEEPFLGEVWAYAWLGAGAVRAGDVDAALEHLTRAAERRDDPGHESHAMVIDAQLALAYWKAGRHAEADEPAERARAAIAATRGRPSGHVVFDAYTGLAELAVLRADEERGGSRHAAPGGALERACRDLATFTRVFPIGAPARWLYAGELAWRRGAPERAHSSWERSRRAAAQLGMQHELALARRRLGERVLEAVA